MASPYIPKRRERGQHLPALSNIVCGILCYALVVLLALMLHDMSRTADFLIGLLP